MKKVLWFLLPLVLICGVVFAAVHTHKAKVVKPVPPILVKLSSVAMASVPVTVMATGNLVANDKTTISPKVGGYITAINFDEGQFVKTGTVLISFENLKEKQQVFSSEAQANLAKSTYDRYLKLSKQNITSPQDIDQYRSDYKKAVAVMKGDRATLADTILRAPINGYLGAKTISVGDYVNAGQSLVTITDTGTLRIDYSVPSRYSLQLQLGQDVQVTADFLPGKKFAAKVSYIASDVDPVTQTIEVHALLDNQEQQLKPGQSVNITQTVGVHENALLIPADTLIANINGNYVYTVKDNKIFAVPIEVGDHYKDQVIVLSGLQPSQKIVSEGQFQVKNGAQVQVVS